MSHDFRQQRPERGPMRLLLYTVPYLLLTYILSTGPLYWQIYAAYYIHRPGFLFYFYYPLVLANEVPYVRNFFDWYLQFWI